MSQRGTSLYDVIGVSPHATQGEIEAACLRLAERYRPDRNPNDTIAAANFAAIERAFEILGDPDKRGEYDKRSRTTVPAGEPIALKHSIVGYLGTVIGGLIMLLAFYSKPSEPGGTAMLFGALVTAFCLSIAIRAKPKAGADVEIADKQAKAFNKVVASTVASLVAVIAGAYFLFWWPGFGSTMEPAGPAETVSVSGDQRLIVDGCERQSERTVKCLVRARNGAIEGYRIQARASKLENGTYIDLPPAIVSAGKVSSYNSAEISLFIPPDADTIYLSVR